jgi:hypothetical protein
MRFLMKTLRPRPTSALIPAFRQNLLLDTLGLSLLSSRRLRSLAPASGRYLHATLTAPDLLQESNPGSQSVLLRQYTPQSPSFALFTAHRSRYSSHAPEQPQG